MERMVMEKGMEVLTRGDFLEKGRKVALSLGTGLTFNALLMVRI